MRVISVVSSKGGVGKTTVAANLGGLLADAGLRVLLLELDSQPTLSSYYALKQKADAGAYEFIVLNLTTPAEIVSKTVIHGLDLILSNDDQGRLSTLLLHAPDGRLRLRNLLDNFRLRYDLLLIDNQGARSVLLEMAILVSDLALSPISPEILAARGLQRGTLKLLSELEPFRLLGIAPPPLATATEPGECHSGGRTDDHPWPARDFRWGYQHLDSRNRSPRPSGISQRRLPRHTGPPNRDAPVARTTLAIYFGNHASAGHRTVSGMARSDIYGEQIHGGSMRRITQLVFLTQSLGLIDLEANSGWQGVF